MGKGMARKHKLAHNVFVFLGGTPVWIKAEMLSELETINTEMCSVERK